MYLRPLWHSGKTESSETWGCRKGLLLLTSFCDLGQLCALPEPQFPHLCSISDSTILVCCEDLMQEGGVRRVAIAQQASRECFYKVPTDRRL